MKSLNIYQLPFFICIHFGKLIHPVRFFLFFFLEFVDKNGNPIHFDEDGNPVDADGNAIDIAELLGDLEGDEDDEEDEDEDGLDW